MISRRTDSRPSSTRTPTMASKVAAVSMMALPTRSITSREIRLEVVEAMPIRLPRRAQRPLRPPRTSSVAIRLPYFTPQPTLVRRSRPARADRWPRPGRNHRARPCRPRRRNNLRQGPLRRDHCRVRPQPSRPHPRRTRSAIAAAAADSPTLPTSTIRT
uniref:(northern house mosquito) hypothetical protein n=1 Tax=Culex pipiens TaxID=7175 RepID=A0A8D8A078_CULPI